MAHDDHGLAAFLRRCPNRLCGRPGGEPLVRLGVEPGRPRELLGGLSGTEEGARQDCVGHEAFVGESLPEHPGGVAACRGETPELVRLPGHSLGVTDDHEPHRPEHSLRFVRTFRYVVADVFTDTPLAGNPLAVFTDGRGIDDEEMQRLARELNLSETVFVLPPEQGGHARIRIFTPAVELPFAGHPTVGTAHVLAAIGDLRLDGDVTRIVLEERVGPVPVTVRAERGHPTFCQLSVARLPEEGPPPPSNEALAEALGLDPAEVLGGEWAPRGWTCGVPYLFVPLRDRSAVARASVRIDKWERALAGTWAPELFVFSRDAERAGSDLRARMFAPAFGIGEDPATGSAAAALAGYLAKRDSRRDGTLRWVVEQGFEMKRPSILEVEADVVGGAVTSVRVGGSSVLVCEGTMSVA